MPATERPILLTGATGFVGMTVLARLLADGHEVHCLIRGADESEADARLRAVLARVEAPSSGRAIAVAGDITSPRLGLGEGYDALTREVGSVIHSAASVSFDLPIEEARAINVEGTQRVLDFAAEVPEVERFTYVSTAYVAGDRRGIVYEEDREASRFRNSYERSKHEAEARVRASDLPWTITRPSIVVGERETGWTSSFNVLYAPLRALGAGAYPVIPARRRAPLDVVSVDYVADAVTALAQHPEAVNGTFHLTAGEHATTIGELGAMAVAGLDRAEPRLVSPRLYRRLVHPYMMRRAAPSTRRLLERSAVYFPYFSMRLRFDDARSRALLAPLGIAPSPLPDYFERLLEFARAARWGRRPLGRAEAAELTGTADVRAPALTPARGPAAVPVR
ncbi:MAG TPA: SDR family oxidoreductase [Solirubrobacteraceae bacterium]